MRYPKESLFAEYDATIAVLTQALDELVCMDYRVVYQPYGAAVKIYHCIPCGVESGDLVEFPHAPLDGPMPCAVLAARKAIADLPAAARAHIAEDTERQNALEKASKQRDDLIAHAEKLGAHLALYDDLYLKAIAMSLMLVGDPAGLHAVTDEDLEAMVKAARKRGGSALTVSDA